jgi:hypothetical protein
MASSNGSVNLMACPEEVRQNRASLNPLPNVCKALAINTLPGEVEKAGESISDNPDGS